MNFTFESVEFVLNLQGGRRVFYISVFQLILDFSPPCLKVQDSFDISASVSQICYTHSVLRKVLDMVLAVVPFGFPKLVTCNKNILRSAFNFCG